MEIPGFKGCLDCEHHKFGDVFHNIRSSCGLGKHGEYSDWWARNGHKKHGDPIDEMPCFQPTRTVASLDKISDLMGQMMVIAKTYKDEHLRAD